MFVVQESHKDSFSGFVEDFDEYVRQGRRVYTWGDHVEIKALSALFEKNVEIRAKGSVQGWI